MAPGAGQKAIRVFTYCHMYIYICMYNICIYIYMHVTCMYVYIYIHTSLSML